MIFKNIKFVGKQAILIIILVSGLLSCSSEKQEAKKNSPIVKKTYEPNTFERARIHAEGNPIFSIGKPKKNDNLVVGTSNILWRASLETLNFMPLQSASYSGGLIITDWYEKQKESIKIEISFQSFDIAVNSIVVKSFKRSCKNSNDCVTTPNSTDFNENIKNKILSKARELSLQDAKNKK